MLIKIGVNRDVHKEYFGTEGSQNENKVIKLTFDIPEELNKYNKRIVFITPEGNLEDVLTDNSYIVTNGITKFKTVSAYIWLTSSENEDWRSKVFEMDFNYNEQSDSEEPTEEELNRFNTVLTQLNTAIDRVAEIEIEVGDISEIKTRVELLEVKVTDLETKVLNFDGRFDIQDEKIQEIENNVKAYDDRIKANTNDIVDLNQEVNSLNSIVDELDKDLTNVDNRVTALNEELAEQEETLNHLDDIKADKSEIPDVSEFIKNTVDDLVNYYKKTETYTQAEVNQLIGAIKTISMKVVPERPAVGETNIIYLVPSKKSEQENIYDEYIYIDSKWELIGSTDIDLNNIYTKEEINQILFDYITSNDLEDILENYVRKEDLKLDNTTITKNNSDELQSVGSILQNGGVQKYWCGTKAEYAEIAEKDPNTLYEILDDIEDVLFDVDGASIEFDSNSVLRIPNNIDLMYQSVLYGNGESGYRKYRNGMLEQWGVATSSANGDAEFTMHQAHKDMNFSVFVEPREQGNFFHYAIPSANQKFRCRIQTRDSASMAVKFQWRSWGRWK